MPTPTRVALFLFSLPVLFACGSTRAAEPPPPLEESVRPGANDRFLAEDLDLQQFLDSFEGESREIAISHEQIVAALHLEPGMTVADIGAGTGLFLAPFAMAVGPEGRVSAVDISPGFVEHLEDRARQGGYDQVQVVLCSERSVDLSAASVDKAFVCDTYHHFEYPRSTLASLFTALKPGGELFVIDFERIPGVTREWVLGHVRAGKETFRAEIEGAGFRFLEELDVEGLSENYVLRFERP